MAAESAALSALHRLVGGLLVVFGVWFGGCATAGWLLFGG
jgi:hypothetical protein